MILETAVDAPGPILGDARRAVTALADFAAGLTYETLPPEVAERGRWILLDTVGAMLGGTQMEFLLELRRRFAGPGGGDATVLSTREPGHPMVAALLNAATTTVLQIDEGHRFTGGHPAIHIVPAALAVAEQESATGAELVAAIVAGYEVAVRIGRACAPIKYYLHPHGNWSTIGAAVAAGKLLRLDAAGLAEVIDGSATFTLFPWRRAVKEGATLHHFYPGFGASNAVATAYGVASGMSAPRGTLVEFFGHLAAQAFKPELLTEGLGKTFEVLVNYFKLFPNCGHLHSIDEAIEELASRQTLDADDVAEIRVDSYAASALLDDPAPVNSLAAKFSAPYAIAARIVFGTLLEEAFAEKAVPDPRVRALALRVRMRQDSECDAGYPAGRPCRVEVELQGGETLVSRKTLPRGNFDNPASDDELLAKFDRLAVPVLGAEAARRLRDALYSVATVTSAREIGAAARSGENGRR